MEPLVLESEIPAGHPGKQEIEDAIREALAGLSGWRVQIAVAHPAISRNASMTLTPGTSLGPYEILALLGGGGMGEVYRARDEKLRRDVAVKVLPTRLSENADALARFEREAQAVAALSHPNILAIHDFGQQGKAVYAVMELLDGESLRARLAAGPLPARKAVEYALQIADGLAAAHDKGIVHRDLKPDNLFITKDGRLKILDFGLARQAPAAGAGDDTDSPTVSRHTDPGTVMGTVGYMSPEQVRGKPVDHRADVFSFGAVLYEMLTAQRAFRGDSAAETMSAILKEEPPEISASGRTAPAGLERIIRHCLEKKPEERFQSARDLAFGLQALSADSERSAGPSGAPTGAPRGIGGRRTAAAAALVGIGTLLGMGLARLVRSPSVAPDMASVRYLTYSGHDTSPAASPDGRTIAFCSDRDGRPRIWLKQLADGSEVALTAGPDDFPRFSPDGSAILFVRTEGSRTSLYRVPLLGGDARKLVDQAASGDWSPDGHRIVFLRLEPGGVTSTAATTVWVAAADGGGQIQIARLAEEHGHPRWSPDGRTIAVTGFRSFVLLPIMLIAADGKETRALDPPPPWPTGRISAVAWLSSTELVYSQAESVAGDSAGGTARLILQDVRSGAARPLAWSPNNGVVLDVLAPGRVVFDARSPRENLREVLLQRASLPEKRPPGDRGAVATDGERPNSPVALRWITRGNSTDRQPVYSPDGERVVFASTRSGNLDLWEISTGSGAVRRLTDDPADDFDPAFTHDGKTLLWSSNRKGHFEIWTAEADGSGARQLTHDGVDATNATSTPDGRWIVYSSGHPEKVGVWKVHRDGSEATLLAAGWDGPPEVSPDGQYALGSVGYGSRSVVVRVVRIADGVGVPFEILVERRRETTARMGRGRWMPGGRSIAFVGQDERGVNGVFVQDFVPGQDTTATRRPLAGFDPEASTESFGISPDGSRIVVAAWEQLFSIMTAEGVPGIAPPDRRGGH